MSTQSDINTAFLWARQVYDEARSLLGDAGLAFAENGLKATGIQTAYGTTLRKSNGQQDDHPFIYIAVEYFYPPEHEESSTGTAAFLAISFFDSHRTGPTAFAGTATWDDNHAKLDHWLINATARVPGWRAAFSEEKDGALRKYKPTEQGRKLHLGITEVTCVEFPLTAIEGPTQLELVVDALLVAREGSMDKLRSLADPSRM